MQEERKLWSAICTLFTIFTILYILLMTTTFSFFLFMVAPFSSLPDPAVDGVFGTSKQSADWPRHACYIK